MLSGHRCRQGAVAFSIGNAVASRFLDRKVQVRFVPVIMNRFSQRSGFLWLSICAVSAVGHLVDWHSGPSRANFCWSASVSGFVSMDRNRSVENTQVTKGPVADDADEDSSAGQDWPQALGASRNGKSSFSLPDGWTPDQMKLAWQIDAGEGFAGPIIVKQVAYLWDRSGKTLRLRAVSLVDGKLLWTVQRPAVYAGGSDPDKGPRATPTYANGKIFAWSGGGILLCVDAKAGNVLWEKNLAKEMPGGEGYFGFGAGVLVIDDTVMVNIGSRTAAVIGLEVATGDLRWKAGKDDPSYAAPVAAKLDGKNVALFVTRLHFYVIDPADGTIIAQTDFGKKGATVNGASPVLLENNQVFLNSAYGVGGRVVKLPTAADPSLTDIWSNNSSFASQYITPVAQDGFLYGTTGREDFNDGQLRCVRAEDGKVMWNQANWPLSHGIMASGKFLALTLDSRLVLIEPSSEKFIKLGEKKLADAATRPMPALANGYYLFRTIASRSSNDPPKWYGYRLVE